MSSDNQPVVATKNGKLEGYKADGIYVFKGVPYAAPPVGKLRWMPPESAESWDGVRPAKEFDGASRLYSFIFNPEKYRKHNTG